MAKGNFVLKHKGQIIPQPVLAKLIAECPTAYGMATVNGKVVSVDRFDGAADVEELMEIQNGLKDNAILFSFNSFEKGHTEGDIQPFSMLIGDNDGDIVLVMAMDGTFPGYAEADSPLSDTLHAAMHVAENIEDLHNAYNGDMERMDNHLEGEKFQKMLSKLSTEPSAFCLMSSTGKIMTKNFGAAIGEYGWGIVSNKYDIDGVKKAEPAAAETGGRKSAFSSFRNKNKVPEAATVKTIGDKPASTDPIVAKVSPERIEELRAKKLATTQPSTIIKENVPLMIRPHHSWKTHGEGKEILMYLYRNFTEGTKQAPSNWKKKPEVALRKGTHEALKLWLSELKTPLQLSDVVFAGDVKAPVTAMADALKKAEATKKVEGVHTINESGAIPDPIDMTANDSDLAAEVSSFKKDMLPKLRDSNSQVILDPKKIKDAESKAKTFTELSGIKFDTATLFPDWAFAQLVEQYPLLARRLITEFRNAYRDMAVLAEQATAPDKVEEPQKTEEPQKEVQTPPPAETAPAAGVKKSAFASFRSKKAA